MIDYRTPEHEANGGEVQESERLSIEIFPFNRSRSSPFADNSANRSSTSKKPGESLVMSAILLATRPSESTQHRFARWFLKFSNWPSNRVFKSYDDIVDHWRDAWNKLIEHPWRIISIGLRDWAHRF